MSSDNTDFDVDNYSMEDLVHILKLQHKTPLEKADIIEAVENMIKTFQGQPKYVKFFLNVQSKLLEEKDLFTEPLAEKQAEKDVETITEMHDLIKKVAPDTVIQTPGVINGTNNTNLSTINNIISFDSQFRPMLINPALSVAGCPNLNTSSQNDINQLTHDPSDYTVDLSFPRHNVTKIKLTSVSIPMKWYVFSGDYGTNYMDISYNGTHQSLTIAEGNYNSTQLIDALNASATANTIDVVFSYSDINGKITIQNNTVHDIQINWYYPNNSGSCGYAFGQKMDYNLGWLLGFRSTTTVVATLESTTGSGILNLKGFDYLFISLDDFVNNKPNQDLITNVKQKNVYKLPDYYNKHTMDQDCNVATFPENPLREQSSCGVVALNPDDINNLTQAQQYTVDQLKSAINGIDVDRYGAPTTSDLLVKLLVDFQFNETIQVKDGDFNVTGIREYFGPVTLRKFRVKLLSKYGHVINLNESDWTFTIQTTENY